MFSITFEVSATLIEDVSIKSASIILLYKNLIFFKTDFELDDINLLTFWTL